MLLENSNHQEGRKSYVNLFCTNIFIISVLSNNERFLLKRTEKTGKFVRNRFLLRKEFDWVMK